MVIARRLDKPDSTAAMRRVRLAISWSCSSSASCCRSQTSSVIEAVAARAGRRSRSRSIASELSEETTSAARPGSVASSGSISSSGPMTIFARWIASLMRAVSCVRLRRQRVAGPEAGNGCSWTGSVTVLTTSSS